jgi:hypothetical protein
MASLDRRIGALEQRLRPPPPRRVVFVTGMAQANSAWVPSAFALPNGMRIERGAGEHPAAFEKRVEAAALEASSAPVVIAVAAEGQDVSEAIVQRWPAASQGEQP